MSGFEVLGVVLGTIPLVVSALEHYQEGLGAIQRWRSYKAELQSLKRKLENENAIYINTCQMLLSGVVGSVEHKKLVDEPFGTLWSSPEIKDQICLRLDHAYERFKDTVLDMDLALREIKIKLDLDERGNVKWTEGRAIIKEIKRATFTIKRSHFEDLLERISQNNQYLKTLTNQSIQLEPERRVKSHGWLFSQLKEASRSVYRAMQNSLVCSCPGSHSVSLRLAKPKLTPRNDESQRLSNSNFQCAVSYRIDSQMARQNNDIWSLVVLRLYKPPPKPVKLVPPQMPAHQNSLNIPDTSAPWNIKMKQLGKKTQGVRFSEEIFSSSKTSSLLHPNGLYSIETAITHPTITAFALDPHGTGVPLEAVQGHKLEDPIDLCKHVRKAKHKMNSGCLGLISSGPSQRYSKFGVYSQPEHTDGITSMVSLRRILEDRDSNFPIMFYPVKLKLVIDISSGVLQLINTSWLPEAVTSRDIMFPLEDGFPVYSKPFIAKKLSDSEREPVVATEALRLESLGKALFSLGILLSEILCFETLDHVWNAKNEKSAPKAMGQFSDWKATADLLNQIQMQNSSKFYSAVHRFLFCEFTCLDFASGDEPFCREVYGKTIALMEEDLLSSQSLW